MAVDRLDRGTHRSERGRRRRQTWCGAERSGSGHAGDTFGAVRCPQCSSMDDKVVDSRSAEDGAAIRRRRECLACGRRFTTYERLEEVPFVVVKRSGQREPFDRAKIVAGVVAAAKNRPVSVDGHGRAGGRRRGGAAAERATRSAPSRSAWRCSIACGCSTR